MTKQRLGFCLGCLIGAAGLWAQVAVAEDWPQFRGPSRTDISRETGLLRSWPEGGPKRVWVYTKGGNAYSGPAIVHGSLYTMGTRDGKEVLLALEAATGKELWTAEIGDVLANDWGDGPRGTPSVDGTMVYAMGGQGNLICARSSDGRVLWQTSMKQLGGGTPGWGYTESVLVDGNQVVCTPGGSKGALAALNKTTGEALWRSTAFTDGAQYASVIAADHNGVRQYIQLTMKSVVGIDAKDGTLLWRTPWPGQTAVIPTPIFHDGHVYVTSGYGVGCKLIQLESGHQVRVVYENNKVMKNHHGGVILVDGHLYGYSDGPGWVCQEFKTGKDVWSSKKLGKGSITCADGMFYCLEEDTGTVALVEVSRQGWNEKGRLRLEPQSSIRSRSGRIWTHPVISHGRLYLRDQDHIYCYDVRGASPRASGR